MSGVYDQTSGLTYATLSDAITGSSANDVLLVPAGTYDENFPSITHSLTIDSVGGMAALTSPPATSINFRAILDVPFDAGVNLSISGLEIYGAARPEPYPNGAGILFEIGNGKLTVSNSYIHDNQEGILTGGPDATSPGGVMSVAIDHSQISNNGAPPGSSYASTGQDHNIYAGALTSFSLTNSYVTGEQGFGHEVKSRALTNVITGNRIQDGPLGLVSYDIDLPNGGNDVVSNNVIEKGPGSVNENILHFGGEGSYPDSSLLVSGNTIINDSYFGAYGLLNQTQDPGTGVSDPATITGNTFYNVNQPNLFQDAFGPPYDIASDNTFLFGAGPTLDTSPGYGVPEPSGAVVLMFAILGLTMLRFSAGVWQARR